MIKQKDEACTLHGNEKEVQRPMSSYINKCNTSKPIAVTTRFILDNYKSECVPDTHDPVNDYRIRQIQKLITEMLDQCFSTFFYRVQLSQNKMRTTRC
jgi:hypothetical protein